MFFQHDWKSLIIGLLIVALLMSIGLYAGKYLVAVGQEPIGKQPTGYFVKVETLNVPDDITIPPVGTFVLYDKTGAKEVWRENVQLATYSDDIQLQNAIDSWAIQYILMYEKQVTLINLATASKIVGKKIEHRQ